MAIGTSMTRLPLQRLLVGGRARIFLRRWPTVAGCEQPAIAAAMRAQLPDADHVSALSFLMRRPRCRPAARSVRRAGLTKLSMMIATSRIVDLMRF